MKISKMLLLLSAAAGLAFTATACSDEDEELKASRFWRDDVKAPAADPYAQTGDVGTGSNIVAGDDQGYGTEVIDPNGNAVQENQPGAYGEFNAEQNDYVQGFGKRITDANAQYAPVYFDFDTFAVPFGEIAKVDAVAAFLKNNPGTGVVVEGNCDERGTLEYNRALGERRALTVKDALLSRGIAESRIRTLSYGEDRPAVQGSDEIAWSRNRRAEFVMVLMNQK